MRSVVHGGSVSLLVLGCADDPSTGGNGGVGATGAGGVATGGMGGGGMGNGGAGGQVDPIWGCVGQLEPASFVAGPPKSVEVSTFDFVTFAPLADVVTRVCAYDDAACSAPLAKATSDGAGTAAVVVPTDSRVYLRHDAEGLVPHLTFSGSPPPMDANPSITWLLISEQTSAAAAAAFQIELDPQRGHIGLEVRDCAGELAEGATIELDTGDGRVSLIYHDDAGTLNPVLTATTSRGRASILNAPAGSASLVARLADTGDIVGERTLLIEAGSISYPDPISPRPEAR